MACSPYPISIRMGNVSLSNGYIARGMNLSVGEPAQSFAFLPNWPLNGTLLYGANGHCLTNNAGPGSWEDAGCTTFRGGAYNPLVSTSRTDASADAFPAESSPYPQVTQVADVLRLNENVSIPNFPMGIAENDWGGQGYTPKMAIGLGTNSSFLNTLMASGEIFSRSWSFFWGLDSAGSSSQLDGSFVLGGYDQAKVTGENHTQPLKFVGDCPSQMLVNITNMVLNFPNGTNASIFGKGNSLAACITPELPTLMTLPLTPYFANWMELINETIYLDRTQGLYYWNLMLPPKAVGYETDLTITLSSGFSTRISSDQIFMPHVSINQNSGELLINSTQLDFVIDSLQASDALAMPQIGWQFFTSTYLHVNHDAGQFTLWNANPTSQEDLVAVDAKGATVTSFCKPSSTDGTKSTTVASSAPALDPSSDSKKATSTGLIAGVSVAAVVVLGAIVGVSIWFFLRKRRQRVANQPSAEPFVAPTDKQAPWTTVSQYNPQSELDGMGGSQARYQSTYELAASQSPHYELQG